MKNIVIIDDQDLALQQVIHEFPTVDKNDLAFRHFDTKQAFRLAKLNELFLVFLDFILTKDKDYGTSLLPELRCEHLVCFSSMKQMSDHMMKEAHQIGSEQIQHVYSVQKMKGQMENQELREVLQAIFHS